MSMRRSRTRRRSAVQTAGIERMAFAQLDVVDRQRGRLRVDAEDGVAVVAEVADGDRESRGIGARGAEQDRLLRAAAGAADAAQLQNANRLAHDAVVAAAPDRVAAVRRARDQRTGARQIVDGSDDEGLERATPRPNRGARGAARATLSRAPSATSENAPTATAGPGGPPCEPAGERRARRAPGGPRRTTGRIALGMEPQAIGRRKLTRRLSRPRQRSLAEQVAQRSRDRRDGCSRGAGR